MAAAQSRLLDRLAAFAQPGVPIDRNSAVRGPAEQGNPAALSALFLSVEPTEQARGPALVVVDAGPFGVECRAPSPARGRDPRCWLSRHVRDG
jgi:hypothetical protein